MPTLPLVTNISPIKGWLLSFIKEMLEKLVLSYKVYEDLAAHARARNIEFFSTAFDNESLEFLVNSIGVKRLKIPSGEITNGHLLLAHANTQKKIIISPVMNLHIHRIIS